MALYAISDLHLPLGVDKPMDIFGTAWENYVERLHQNWQSVVKKDDVVVLPGDFSWATYISDAKKDFDLLNELNGRKILLKGNHDYWWETANKMNRFVKENGYNSISFLQNNSFEYEDKAICGTRGWPIPGDNSSDEDKKIYSREAQRLELSLSAAAEKEKIVFMHYPPICDRFRENEFTRLFEKYNVGLCIYGHLHAKSASSALTGDIDGVKYLLVSCDYLGFMPVKLFD